MQTTNVKPINKTTIKELKKWQKLAENEIVEYEEFIQIIKAELRGRKK